ncbi:hypothetical protein [Spartinivicinus ruber]|uniref:hypothetical protein n=1 Tax=Spartinivicinus ruber TaxID=2683272 RepID=UPI0013D56CCE|nr:hypothetical protein [Spartinivicinus ruber]
MSKFKFQVKWKEELIVIGEGGQFILELPMGVLSVYLPSESTWQLKAPEWARNSYIELKDELESWCIENKAKLIIEETASVDFDGK